MTIAIGIIIFILIAAFTHSYPATSFISCILIGVALAYLGALEYLIDEENGKQGWLVAAALGFALGVVSKVFDKGEPQNR
ncbi:hypothetical protein P4V86_03630 [Brevibacillus laterosporus]|uniref:hypothetical protein n=1 Tax=Brevibacillus laterosporus TaxID=1465 RepID=UPI00037DEBD0|nr:hypothetical protein [Brevibacillus laterosporus]ATO48608.1 hypothetical protein BrL25_05445 [Brevibacillus laterosporus DSM 25]MED2002449.1 hypothetical protein [Brevibacillus laterosporus]